MMAAGLVLERRNQVRPSGLERRGKPKNDSGYQRQQHRKRQHAVINSEVNGDGEIHRQLDGRYQPRRQVGQQQP